MPAVRNLTLAYALAGADCIDFAADPAVLAAAQDGLDAAKRIISESSFADWLSGSGLPNGLAYKQPLLMVSVSAGEDPHFRKAWFDAARCPADCSRPCEQVCPADAIDRKGVVRDRCYGCGRCLPICPLGLIAAQSQPTSIDAIAQRTLSQVSALEIHTQVGQYQAFRQLWQVISPWTKHLCLISISCPDGDDLIDYLKLLRQTMNLDSSRTMLLWQTDGRPMSGDIGKGTTHAAVRLAQKVLASDLGEPVQLAGGTNQYTVLKLRELGLWTPPNRSLTGHRSVSGIAYGSYARRLLMPVLEQTHYLEEVPQALQSAVALAKSLVSPLKQNA